MDILNGLNENQAEAVSHTEGYLRVIAGAGSGKTKLLVSRYAYLVQYYGINPGSILCVTFTNKAAGEMKCRIRSLIGEEYDTSLICTYHGFCVRVLREDCEKLFYPKEFQIIDTAQQKAMLGEIYQKRELKLDHASFEKLLKLIADDKADGTYVTRMCSREHTQILARIESFDDEIVESYLQQQKKVFALDFHDLINFAIHVLQHYEDVRVKWQDRLNYIQVDEFQDSSVREMTLVDLLAAKYRNLMIVGDPDQNIYEWRGSDVRLLVDFDKSHRNTRTIFLNRNYRSTPQILQCANTLIAKNRYRLKKNLFTENPEGKSVVHIHAKTESDEAESIIAEIARARKSQFSFSDIAILYRAGFQSRIIEKKFTENGIPYEIFGGVKFYQRMEIQDIVAYLRLIAFDDNTAFKRIINTPRRRMGRRKLQFLQEKLQNDSFYETLHANLDDPVFRGSGAAEFTKMIEKFRQNITRYSIAEMVNAICEESGYETYIRELGDMERFDNLSEFKRLANEFVNNNGESVTLQEFLNHIALQTSDETNEDTDAVKLMTIHAAKGLEFPCVFVIGFSEGIFPSSKTIEERKEMGLEEERRLCYVAITRAEKWLYLTDSEGFSVNGIKKLPSRFLTEIGEENYKRIGRISKDLLAESRQFIRKQMLQPNADSSGNKVGSDIMHPAFGHGVILEAVNGGNTYKVKFDSLPNERYLSAEFIASMHADAPKIPEPDIPPKHEFPVSTVPAAPPEPDHPAKLESLQKPETKGALEENPAWLVPEAIHDLQAEEEFSETENDGSEQENRASSEIWRDENVPRTGWSCTGISDLGAPSAVCQLCGHQVIRYVHHMVHPHDSPMDVGCVCAGKMEGNLERAKQREQDFKKRQNRKASFMKKQWKQSKFGNPYLKIRKHLIVLYMQRNPDVWKYAIDNKFCSRIFHSKEEAMSAAFDALEEK